MGWGWGLGGGLGGCVWVFFVCFSFVEENFKFKGILFI